MRNDDRNALKKIRGRGAADNRELSKVLESMLTRGDKADRIVAEGAAVEMRREQPPNLIAQKMLSGAMKSPRRYNKRVRIHGSAADIPQFDGINLSSKGEGDFYIRRVGPNAGKTTRERNGPSDIAVSIDTSVSGYLPDYAYYLFQSIEAKLNARKLGSLQQTIRQSDIYEILGEQVIPRSSVDEMERKVQLLKSAEAMSVSEAELFLKNIHKMPVAHNPETGEVNIQFEQQVKLQEASRIITQAAKDKGMTVNQYLERGTGPRTGRSYSSKNHTKSQKMTKWYLEFGNERLQEKERKRYEYATTWAGEHEHWWDADNKVLEIYSNDKEQKLEWEDLFDSAQDALQWEVQATIGQKPPKKMRYVDNHLTYTLSGLKQPDPFTSDLEYSLIEGQYWGPNCHERPVESIKIGARKLLKLENSTYDRFYYKKKPLSQSSAPPRTRAVSKRAKSFGTKHSFELYSIHQTRQSPKAYAQEAAARFRNNGYNARVIPMKEGWAVWKTFEPVRTLKPYNRHIAGHKNDMLEHSHRHIHRDTSGRFPTLPGHRHSHDGGMTKSEKTRREKRR